MHTNVAYRDFPTGPGGLPKTEKLASAMMSLSVHHYLSEVDQDRIVQDVAAFKN
nr:hypothetical protein [Henriciella mobilis]